MVVHKEVDKEYDSKLRKYVKGRYRRRPVPYKWDTPADWQSRSTFYEIVREEKPESVLDIGCGQGQDSMPISSMGVRYVGIDPHPKNIENARKKNPEGDFRLGFMQELPFEDNSFDWSYSCSVWEGLPELEDMLLGIKEALRVTKYSFFNIDFGGEPRYFLERYMAIPMHYRVEMWRVAYHQVIKKAIVMWRVDKTELP